MKCKYRFKVDGTLRLDRAIPVNSGKYQYEFEIGHGKVTHLLVTVELPNREQWPEIIPNPAPGVKYEIQSKLAHLPSIQAKVRGIEGALAVFGLRSIEVNFPTIQWIPETEEERKALPLTEYSQKLGEADMKRVSPTPFDIVARAVLAAEQLAEARFPLTFFRRGTADLNEGNL
jgi:hypothetical protein